MHPIKITLVSRLLQRVSGSVADLLDFVLSLLIMLLFGVVTFVCIAFFMAMAALNLARTSIGSVNIQLVLKGLILWYFIKSCNPDEIQRVLEGIVSAF
jgi:uncharacterized protein YqhQ